MTAVISVIVVVVAARNIVQNTVVVPVNAFQILDCGSMVPWIIGVSFRGFRGQIPLIDTQSLYLPPIKSTALRRETIKEKKEELEMLSNRSEGV
jgi:hypothetical protein